MKVNQWLKRAGAALLSVMMLVTMIATCGLVLADNATDYANGVYFDLKNGDDTAAGTETAPLKSFVAAFNKVNELGLTGDARKVVAIGSYTDVSVAMDLTGVDPYTENITLTHVNTGSTIWLNTETIKLGGPVTFDAKIGRMWNVALKFVTNGYDIAFGSNFADTYAANGDGTTVDGAKYDATTGAYSSIKCNPATMVEGSVSSMTITMTGVPEGSHTIRRKNPSNYTELGFTNQYDGAWSFTADADGNATVTIAGMDSLPAGTYTFTAFDNWNTVQDANAFKFSREFVVTAAPTTTTEETTTTEAPTTTAAPAVSMTLPESIIVTNGAGTEADPVVIKHDAGRFVPVIANAASGSYIYLYEAANFDNVGYSDYSDYNTPGNTIPSGAGGRTYLAVAETLPEGSYVLALDDKGDMGSSSGSFDVVIYFNVEATPATTTEAPTTTTTAAPAVTLTADKTAYTAGESVVLTIGNLTVDAEVALFPANDAGNIASYNPLTGYKAIAAGTTSHTIENVAAGKYVPAVWTSGWNFLVKAPMIVVEEATTTTTTVAAVTPYVVTLNKTTIVAGEDLVASISDLPENAYISIFTNVRDSGALGAYDRFGDSPVLSAGTTTHTFSTAGMTPGRYAVALHQDGWVFPGNVAVFTVEAAPTTTTEETTTTTEDATTTTTAAALTGGMTANFTTVEQGSTTPLVLTVTGELEAGTYTLRRKNPEELRGEGQPFQWEWDGVGTITVDAEGNGSTSVNIASLPAGTYTFKLFKPNNSWLGATEDQRYVVTLTVEPSSTPVVTPKMEGDITSITEGEDKTLTLTITGLDPNGQYLLRRKNPSNQIGEGKPFQYEYDGACEDPFLVMDENGAATVTIPLKELAYGAYQYRLFIGHNWGSSWSQPTGEGFNFDLIINPVGEVPDPTLTSNKTTIEPGYTFSFTITDIPGTGYEFGLLEDDGTGNPVPATLVSGSYQALGMGNTTKTVTVNTAGKYVAAVWTSGWNFVLTLPVTVETAATTTTTTVGGGTTTTTTPVGSTPEEIAKNAAANHSYHNKSTADDAIAAVQAALTAAGYDNTVTIENWHLIRAVAGAKDQDGIIWEGYEGHVAATIVLDDTTKVDFTATVEPGMTEYEFASVAQQVEPFRPMTEADAENNVDWEFYTGLYPGCQISYTSDGGFFVISEDGKLFIAYSGMAEKIIFPEGVERLVNASVDDGEDWWYETELANVRCMILPDSLKILPDQFCVPFRNNIECVIMGDNVTEAHGWHTFMKCYYLKTLRLSENLENLTEESLFQCLSLYDFRLPTNLKTIAKGALHLSALRDIYVPAGVEYIAQEAFAWPMRTLQMLNPRPQGNQVDQEVIDELEPAYRQAMWRDPTNRETYITRSLYILTPDADYQTDIQSFWNSSWGVQTVYCYYIDGSSTADLIAGGYTGGSDGAVTNSTFDMDKNHVIVALEDVADRLVVDANTTEADLLAQFMKNVYSTNVKNINLKNVVIDNDTGAASGEVYGTVLRDEVLLITFNVEAKPAPSIPGDSNTTTTAGATTTTQVVTTTEATTTTTQAEVTTTTQAEVTTTTEAEVTTTATEAQTTTTTAAGSDVETPDTGYEVPVAMMLIVMMGAGAAVFFLRKKVTE